RCQPKIQKGKGQTEKKAIHPYSRKAAQIARGIHQQEKKDRQKNEKAVRLSSIGEKLLWFQSQLHPDKSVYSRKEACEIIERYLHRFDNELEQIELVNSIKGRQGRQHSAREDVIKHTIEREKMLYEGYGIEIPDILNGKHLKIFREWNGDLQKLPNIKMRTFSSQSWKCDVEQCTKEDEEEDLTTQIEDNSESEPASS
uniref:Translation machinery-associated protein 16 n=1 Tax=Erpetoichthys calabaricus TaxID=27687 RepID=A0A8C4S5I4_ERPCA